MKLENPTVSDVIKLLQTLPPDAPFRMDDADTGWEINIIHVELDAEGFVSFSGKYGEMGARKYS